MGLIPCKIVVVYVYVCIYVSYTYLFYFFPLFLMNKVFLFESGLLIPLVTLWNCKLRPHLHIATLVQTSAIAIQTSFPLKICQRDVPSCQTEIVCKHYFRLVCASKHMRHATFGLHPLH